MPSPRAPRPPLGLVVAAAIAAVFVSLPIVALLARAPWSRTLEIARSSSAQTALRVSLVCSLSSAAICAIVGIPLAYLLARTRFWGRRQLRAVLLLPIVLPPVVGGIALLQAFGRNGVIGSLLYDVFGIRLPFTTAGAIVAETFVALPFFLLATEGALRSSNRDIDDVAATLGASPLRVLQTVTLPAIGPSVRSALVLCWARALGEFGATITFAGASPGKSQTLPLEVYRAYEGADLEGAVMLSVAMVVVSLVVLSVVGTRAFSSLGRSSATIAT